jgi:hypothetical protein
VAELTTAINDYIAHNNAYPKPFTWTKSAYDIILKVNRDAQPWAGPHCNATTNCKPVRETLH